MCGHVREKDPHCCVVETKIITCSFDPFCNRLTMSKLIKGLENGYPQLFCVSVFVSCVQISVQVW